MPEAIDSLVVIPNIFLRRANPLLQCIFDSSCGVMEEVASVEIISEGSNGRSLIVPNNHNIVACVL